MSNQPEKVTLYREVNADGRPHRLSRWAEGSPLRSTPPGRGSVGLPPGLQIETATFRRESEMNDQEQCVHCRQWFPKPVELHHAEEDCKAIGGITLYQDDIDAIRTGRDCVTKEIHADGQVVGTVNVVYD